MERFENIEAIGVMVLSFGIFRNCRIDDRFFFRSSFKIFLYEVFLCIHDSDNALEILNINSFYLYFIELIYFFMKYLYERR